jgi:hypothetical protein
VVDEILTRQRRRNPLLWHKAKRKLVDYRNNGIGIIVFGRAHLVGNDWPELLRPSEIAEFQYGDNKENRIALNDALNDDIEKGVIDSNDTVPFSWEGKTKKHYFINASCFCEWLRHIDSPSEIIKDWFDVWIYTSEDDQSLQPRGYISGWRNNSDLTKGNKQEIAITEVIKLKGFDPLCIPDGEKGTLEAICKHDYPELFNAENSFLDAWKRGVKCHPQKWRMQSHPSYSRSGKK